MAFRRRKIEEKRKKMAAKRMRQALPGWAGIPVGIKTFFFYGDAGKLRLRLVR